MQPLTEQLLRSPTFHHGVRAIHRRVQDVRHGRDPNEPLRHGEATQHPDQGGFFKYFVEELKMQAQGKETKLKGPK